MVHPQVPSAASAQVGPATVPSAHFVEATLGPGDGHFSGGHAPELTGTQVQTEGELSKRVFTAHDTF
jgi:hypothetical protein